MCHGSCRILVHVKDGRAVKVEGDPEGPINLRDLGKPIGTFRMRDWWQDAQVRKANQVEFDRLLKALASGKFMRFAAYSSYALGYGWGWCTNRQIEIEETDSSEQCDES